MSKPEGMSEFTRMLILFTANTECSDNWNRTVVEFAAKELERQAGR